MLVHFGVHVELPKRSKNETKNKLMFKRFWGPLEISGPGSGVVIVTGDGKPASSSIGVAVGAEG